MLDGYEEFNRESWDGYGAAPIMPRTLALARAIASILTTEPAIAPSADGTIGFEWITPKGKVFMDVGPDGLSVYAQIGATILCMAADRYGNAINGADLGGMP